MGSQVCKIARFTGEIIHRGYVHPDTRMSEATAEVVAEHYANRDTNVGFVVLNSEVDYTPDQVLALANGEWNVKLGYDVVFDVATE